MYASSRVREVERRAASACNFETSVKYVTKSTEGGWGGTAGTESDGGVAVPTSHLEDGTTIRVAPMERSRGGWDEEHFHEKLRVPEGSSAGRGLVVTLEAMGRECVALALSPQPYFDMGKTYAVHLGAAGNLSTVIRRRLPSGNEAIDSTFPGRICTDDRFTPYWIILQDGVLSAGVGTCPGQKCVATLDDRLYHQLRSGVDAVKFVGIGNSALGRQARDLKVRNVKVMPLPSTFGMGGVPINEVEAINIDQDASLGADGAAPDAELMAEYERECAKAKARAEKFGTEYKQPPPDAFFKWSEARRLQANPEKGFITGIDVMSAEEKAKAERRKERFAEDEKNRKRERGDDVQEGEEAENNMDDAEVGEGDINLEESKGRDSVSLEQSWDNEDLVIRQRFDPPQYLWAAPPDPDAPGENDGEMEGGAEEGEEKAVPVPEKVHVFSFDWAAFKQIRSDDIMAHFAVYGPSYVEWLGELSCNVHFEDKFSAARALAGMSRDIPTPPPEHVARKKQDTVANQVTAKNPIGNEHKEEKDNSVKVKEDSAQEGSPTKGAEPSFEDDKQAAAETDDIPPPSDLGAMGWRLALQPVRKVANDRFGRRGTRARVLMRVATSEDVLVERPTEWPRPPPGFTTKRVLGPGSDFDTRWRQRRHRGDGGRTKRRRRDGGGHRGRDRGYDNEEERWDRDRYYSDEDYDSYDENMDGYDENERDDDKMPTALDQGLKSSRAGFSVEEMEAERAARKQAETDI